MTRLELDTDSTPDRENGLFGVVRLADGEERPRSYLHIGPRANGMELEKVNEHGTVVASYTRTSRVGGR